MSNHSTQHGSLMHSNEGNYQENPDGTYSVAVPLPFYGIKKHCQCGKSFWKEDNYRKHYIAEHTDGKKYKRTPTGLVETGLVEQEGE